MRFSCDECGRSYVAAEEVAGRAFRMRCKDCGHEIVVHPDSVPPASVAAAPALTPAPPNAPPQRASAPTAQRASAPPSPPAATRQTPAPAPIPAPRSAPAAASAPRRSSFDPFEGQDVSAGVSVEAESLEILDRTPPAIRLPQPRPDGSGGARSAVAASTPAPARTTAPRARAGRMLPAEDEAMLGPPGEEGRGGFPRWIIAVVLAGVAVAGGILLRR